MRMRHAASRTGAGGGAAEINVTPLIDVVMCLIIFFLLVGKLSLDAAIDLPATGLGQVDQARAVVISILGTAEKPVYLIDGVTAPVATLAADLRRAIEAKGPVGPSGLAMAGGVGSVPGAGSSAAAGGSAAPITTAMPVPVKVRADRALPYSAVDPVLKACAQAGLTSVRLVTERPS